MYIYTTVGWVNLFIYFILLSASIVDGESTKEEGGDVKVRSRSESRSQKVKFKSTFHLMFITMYCKTELVSLTGQFHEKRRLFYA